MIKIRRDYPKKVICTHGRAFDRKFQTVKFYFLRRREQTPTLPAYEQFE